MALLAPSSPSALHQVVAKVLPRVRRARDLDDAESERRRILRWQSTLPDALPTRLVPGFERRFTLEVDRSAGWPVYVFSPRGRRVRRTVLYGHGGGYMAPIDPFHVLHAASLARRLDARIVMPDYPLAPTHTWRDSRDDLVDLAVAWAEHADCTGEKPLVLAGDSAGGGLVLAIAQAMRDRVRRDGSGPTAGAMVLHAPWVDLTSTAPGTEEFSARDPWLFLGKIRLYAQWWAGAEPVERPEVSPGLGDLSDLPPALMFHGTLDTLAPACRVLAERAEAAGWQLTSIEERDLLHVYSIFPLLPEARRAMRRTLDFLA
ncbi:alpha/beta hydrolase [Nocardioides sp. Y6]|uniref:Alpha/beta hydrolase n=1 Tax=Nocardioides malaquae TaxID=2773426 RepID=A0ABR9RV98_9ACTN|nr:alpha/beta hydrolase [Nocardioides malaquae]MBE7325484.1 alpha/beta hydrolase [Nocardioides malaquae]